MKNKKRSVSISSSSPQVNATFTSPLRIVFSEHTTLIDGVLYGNLSKLKNLCRGLATNNDYAKAYVRLWVNNIVGPKGPQLRPNIKSTDGTLNEDKNNLVSKHWKRWQTSAGNNNQSLLDIVRLSVRTLAIDEKSLR